MKRIEMFCPALLLPLVTCLLTPLPLVTCLLTLTLLGCSQQAATPAASDQTQVNSATAVDGSKFLLAAEPEGAMDVIKVRAEAKDQDDVVIAGRIGGSANPWVDGRAAFSIVDPSLKSCLECGSHDCPKPWDYC